MLSKRFVAGVVSAVALCGSTATGVVVGSAGPALAVEGTLPGTAASSWQTNGTVWALAYANGIVYLGGSFTSVRPPGSPAGANQVARWYLAAFSASTGALVTSFHHSVAGTVWGLAASPDGRTVYAVGDFTRVDGVTRNRVAAFSTSTGALLPFAPSANARVRGVAVSPTTVYLGGSFTTMNGRTANRVAAVSASSGALLSGFSASANDAIYQMALSKQDNRLYLAGAFTTVDGNTSTHSAAALDPTTGARLPFPAGSVIPAPSSACSSVMKTVKTDATTVYFGAEGTGVGCFDGTFAANVSDGTVKWVSRCLGATQAVEVINGVLYVGSHAHDDSADARWDPDAFGQVAPGQARHLLARNAGTGRLTAWYPNTNGGTSSGTGLGPRAMATDGAQLFVGGEFTTVNGTPQQGFTRFSPGTGDRSRPGRPAAPTAVAGPGRTISVFVQPPLDLDDTDLVVRVYRDGASTPFATARVHSLFWRQPVLAFHDTTQAVGTTHSYTADAVEAGGSNVSPRSTASPSVTVVSTPPAYPAAVMADDPAVYWRLGEPTKPLAADSSTALSAGQYYGTETFAQPGAVGDGNTAVTLDGATGYVASSAAFPTPGAFSVEAWFRTTTASGGMIIGFGNRQGGYDVGGGVAQSTTYDKHIYMTNDGRLVFGVWVGHADTLTTAASYNDGRWHDVVGTLGSNGMSLYVDGAPVGHDGQTASQDYTGYWRVGGDNLSGWPDQPSSPFFAGTIDEVAVYNTALSATQVANHHSAALQNG